MALLWINVTENSNTPATLMKVPMSNFNNICKIIHGIKDKVNVWPCVTQALL
jgi:hypothetical protein